MKTHKILIILCIILVVISPALFSLPALCSFFDFSNTGEVGSTIGGITQPFIGVLSILLLYITLTEQIKINKENQQFNIKNRDNNDLQIIMSLQDKISKQMRNTEWNYFEDYKIKGIRNIKNLFNHGFTTTEEQINLFLEDVDSILNDIKIFEVLIDNSYIYSNIKIIFLANLKDILIDLKSFYNPTDNIEIVDNNHNFLGTYNYPELHSHYVKIEFFIDRIDDKLNSI